MGREGEVVQDLVKDFEKEYPEIHVRVQQIPWSAAHEKLLTSYVGRSTPDLAQLGNTWLAEFSALRALEPLDGWIIRSSSLAAADYFPGIWDTNVIDGVISGVPWYVDTRLLFYRKDTLAKAGYQSMPTTWDGWLAAMRAIKQVVGPDRYAILLPVNEPTELTILGLQAGSPLLAEHATRGAFTAPAFRRGFDFYLGLFREGLAPPLQNTQIANLYQEFSRGYFAMYVTGPWNLGEFKRQLPPEQQDSWGTAPLPGPDGPSSGVSLAGGSSLVLFRDSRHKAEAWALIEYLSRPDVQSRFYTLSGDLPARLEAWKDPALSADARIGAFREQLLRAVPSPKVPEWENIFQRIHPWAAQVVYGKMGPDSALAGLDREVDRILEKRRWLMTRRGLAAEAGK
jgi:multiple sugar transport system substrate-binding protein